MVFSFPLAIEKIGKKCNKKRFKVDDKSLAAPPALCHNRAMHRLPCVFSVFAAACLQVVSAGADVVFLSSGRMLLGHVRGEEHGNLRLEFEMGEAAIDINTVEFISRSPAPQDTYYEAARRLARDGQRERAAQCVEKSIKQEPDTLIEARALQLELEEFKHKPAATQPPEPSEAQRAADLRKKGEAMIRQGNALNVKMIDSKLGVNRDQIAQTRIKAGEKLLAEAKAIEDRLRPPPAPAPAPEKKTPWLIYGGIAALAIMGGWWMFFGRNT